ncbi:HemK family protein methyltransferase [Candidatus Saccharibacteria bacterium]|nr:HemK family protein methyltransferase [Candidatus Saccharibacteria bacterium]
MKETSPDNIANFYGRDFFVDQNVLTPRPETEQIIDEVLSLLGKPILPGVKPESAKLNPQNLTILDVGTGSGCIAITLSLELPQAKIYASDISKKALKIAQKNAKNLSAPLTTIISYLLENVNITPDIIVANLPYVDKNWGWLDQESLKQDPDIALYAEDGGLKLIKELLDTATSKYLILEADPIEHSAIINYAKNYQLVKQNGFILVFIRL